MDNFIINIKNQTEKELINIQIYLFNSGYEWEYSGRILRCLDVYYIYCINMKLGTVNLELNELDFFIKLHVFDSYNNINEFNKTIRKNKLKKLLDENKNN